MKQITLAILIGAALLTLPACKKDNSAENAGEAIDNAAEKTKDKMKEGAEKVGDAAEKAGDKIKDATN